MTLLSLLIMPGAANELPGTLSSVRAALGSTGLAEVIVPAGFESVDPRMCQIDGSRFCVYDDPLKGLTRSSGDWVALVRPGDVWPLDRLSSLGRAPVDTDVLYSDVYLSWGGHPTRRRWSEMVRVPEPDELSAAVMEKDCVPTSSLVLRRTALDDLEDGTEVGSAWGLDLLLQLLERKSTFKKEHAGLPVAAVPRVDNEQRLDHLLGTASAFRRAASRGTPLADPAQRRVEQLVVQAQIFSRYQSLSRRARLAPLQVPEVRRSLVSTAAQAGAAISPAGFARIHKTLKEIRPLDSTTLDILSRQPLHDCSSRPDSLCRTNPLVSVVVTCYNYGQFLASAIDSALAQSHSNVEVIVMDDGSTDDTPAVSKAYGESIRYLRHENMGVAATRNRAAGSARGSFVTFLDADNTLHPLFVEELLGVFCDAGEDRSLQFAYCQMQVVGRERHYSAFPSFNVRRLGWGNYIDACSLLRAGTLSLSSYSPGLPAWEDWDFYLSIVECGGRGQLVDLPLLVYSRHQMLASRGDAAGAKDRQRRLRRLVWERHPTLVPEPYKGLLRLRRLAVAFFGRASSGKYK